ncbi:MAG: hypothetical protein JXR73_23455 [Candidatus Omnitrophica bacterium]|nr:hypothetical protein [Candidatus Omnitrophota bacterium]
MRRAQTGEHDQLLYMARGFLTYLCIIIFFGGVILVVHAAMEVKRIRYSLTEANNEKTNLLEELRKINNQISELERYDLIAERIDAALPYLAPPRHPAIELKVPGLQTQLSWPEAPASLLEDNSPLAKMRRGWQRLQENMRTWFQTLIE